MIPDRRRVNESVQGVLSEAGIELRREKPQRFTHQDKPKGFSNPDEPVKDADEPLMHRRLSEDETKFLKFHREHPQVYEYFKKHAFMAINAGSEQYSHRAIMQVVKWKLTIEAKSDRYKGMAIDFGKFYAKFFARDFPRHKFLFRTTGGQKGRHQK